MKKYRKFKIVILQGSSCGVINSDINISVITKALEREFHRDQDCTGSWWRLDICWALKESGHYQR